MATKAENPVTSLDKLAFSPREVQQLTGLGRNTVYAALADRSLPSVRIRNRILIPRAALERLLNGGAEVGRAGQ